MITTSTADKLPSSELRAAKRKAELQIAAILADLEQVTGLAVREVGFEWHEIKTPDPNGYATTVTIARQPTVTIALELA